MSTEWGEPYSGHALILLRKCTQYEFPVISKGILLVWIQPKLLELIKESLHLWEERRGGRSFTFILYPQCIYTWFISYTHHLNIMCRLEQKQVMWQIGNTKTPKNKNKNKNKNKHKHKHKNNPDHYMTRCLQARVIIVYGVEMVLCVIAYTLDFQFTEWLPIGASMNQIYHTQTFKIVSLQNKMQSVTCLSLSLSLCLSLSISLCLSLSLSPPP